MPIGPSIRRLVGPVEPQLASAYRRIFIDLAALARTLRRLAPAETILEIGAGDGYLATELCSRREHIRYLGIDVAAGTGRMFTGDRAAASFRTTPLSDLDPDLCFDLVVFSDVLHHVAPVDRGRLIALAWQYVRPGGHLAIKEWERRRNLAHLLAFASDRYVSGHRGVSFMRADELMRLVTQSVATPGAVSDARVPPRPNNLLLIVQKPAAA